MLEKSYVNFGIKLPILPFGQFPPIFRPICSLANNSFEIFKTHQIFHWFTMWEITVGN